MIILLVEVVFAVGISQYYYSAVHQTLQNRADLIDAVFSQYYEESSSAMFRTQVRDYIASFSVRDKIELMTIDAAGSIDMTSSGFAPEMITDMPDYEEALVSGERTGSHIDSTGSEKIMAMSFMTTATDDTLSAVRLVVSLERIDRQIAFWIVCVALLGILVLLMVLFSSSYFLNSIVNPIGEIGLTARKIAAGDFGARLKSPHRDEIGELCETINYMAERLSETEKLKNDFISSVSHELRTPLTAIQGWGETILNEGSEDREILQKGMQIIISETGRLSHMVEELLDFSRMQSGRLKLIYSRMDPLAELSEVVLMYTQQARQQGIDIQYDESDEIIPMTGDKNKIRQVFVNIIDNAVKYSNRGGTVRVSTRTTDKMLEVLVEDTGIGIREEDLPQVKDRFFKADTTRRSSGIGLAVADEIVTRHGGSIEIRSQYGRGTCVTVRLPFVAQSDSQTE